MRMLTLMSCSFAIALISTGQSARAEDGRLSQDTLSQMGLGGMVAMSDAEAESVRGLGFFSSSDDRHHSRVEVSGSSYANIGSQDGSAHSENSYSSEGHHSASGHNESHAGVEVSTSHGNYGNGNHGNGNYGGSGGGNGCGNNRGCAAPGCGNSHPGGGNGGNNCYHGGGGGSACRTTSRTVNVYAGGSSAGRAH